MVTKRDDDRPTDNRQGEYRAICHGKVGRQSFAIYGKFMRKEGDNDSQQTPIHGYFQIEYKQVL